MSDQLMQFQGSDGTPKVVSPTNPAPVSDTATTNTVAVLGATTDAAITSNATGTLSGKLRGLVAILADVWDSVNHRLHVTVDNGNPNGQALMANSSPVVIASDQSNLPDNLKQINSVAVQMYTADGVAVANVLEIGVGILGSGSVVNRWEDVQQQGDNATLGVGCVASMKSIDGTHHWNFERMPNVYKTIKAQAITSGTPVSVWTPTSGKKFRVMGYSLSLSVAGSILFEDTTGGGNEFWRTPLLAAGIGLNSPPGLINGFLSAAANNQLFLDVTANGNVSGFIFGTEE